MDLNNHVIKLCMEGTKAEFNGQKEEAYKLYLQAWENKKNDFEACIAAHYIARFQTNPDDIFYWNKKALDCANTATDNDINEFYPSLYVNMGYSYELLGNINEAKYYYKLAEDLGLIHQPINK